MSIYPQQTERETIIADAASSLGKTPAERAAMFADLLATIEMIWRNVPLQEQERRRKIARKLDPRPDPWWKNIRKELWPNDHVSAQ